MPIAVIYQIIKNAIKGLIHMSTIQLQVGSKTQADMLYLHENGSPGNNIPARPVVAATLSSEQAQSLISQMTAQATTLAMLGDTGGATQVMQALSERLAQMVKAKFGSGQLAPNKASTIAKKGSNAPLVDSGSLRDSIQGWLS